MQSWKLSDSCHWKSTESPSVQSLLNCWRFFGGSRLLFAGGIDALPVYHNVSPSHSHSKATSILAILDSWTLTCPSFPSDLTPKTFRFQSKHCLKGTANPPSHVTIPQSHFLSEGRAGSIGFINLFIFGYNPTSHYNPIMIPLGCWNSHIFLGHIPLSHQKIPLGSWETNSGQENLQGSRKKERNIPWRRKFRPAQSRPTSASSTSTLKLSQNRDPKNCQTWQVGSHTSPKMLGKCGKNGYYVALSPINRCL